MKHIIILVFLFFLSIEVQSQPSFEIGQPAPEFKLPYATKDTIVFTGLSLNDIVGKRNIVIAFYPADWSGGCTKELCTMRDNFEKLGKLDAEILAVSGDYVFSHREWAKHLNLPFKLLSDHDHSVAKKYSSYNDKMGFNKRTVFVVGKDGKLAYIDMDYKVNDEKDFNDLTMALEKLK